LGRYGGAFSFSKRGKYTETFQVCKNEDCKFEAGILLNVDMQNIFVYGTLQSPEIVKKLTGKSFKITPAILPGYKRYCIKNCDYPAVIQQNDIETTGFVLENVDDLSIDIISYYEGDEYKIQKITVYIDGKSLIVLAFVWAKEIELLEDIEWDFHRFEKKALNII
jgi:gamma-glutamylcyclotransferase (GGCT)/AIG2-like uncharacterized protein YtfP